MKFILCVFALALSVAIYPVTMLQHSEMLYIFNLIETDFFNWYRMILVSLMIPFIALKNAKLRVEWPIAAYLFLLLLSSIASRYPETSIYGTPMHHEGLLAILGYFGIYQAVKRTGIFYSLEKCLDAVVFITAGVAVLQVKYGNFLNFPLFKLLIPEIKMTAETWPIYANMGGPNNLGLFCSLFTPYALIRKKWIQFTLLLALLIGCQSRGAWLSVVITTALISRKYLLYIVVVALSLSVFRHDIITERGAKILSGLHYPIQDKDLSGRGYMWKRAVPVLKESILIGKGPATYLHYVPQFHPRGDAIGFLAHAIDRPHNMYINIWESSGLLSLLLLAYWMRKTLKESNDAALKMGVVGYLIAGVFTDSVLCVTPYLSIFLGGIINGSNDEARRYDKGTKRTRVGDGSACDPVSYSALQSSQRNSEIYVS